MLNAARKLVRLELVVALAALMVMMVSSIADAQSTQSGVYVMTGNATSLVTGVLTYPGLQWSLLSPQPIAKSLSGANLIQFNPLGYNSMVLASTPRTGGGRGVAFGTFSYGQFYSEAVFDTAGSDTSYGINGLDGGQDCESGYCWCLITAAAGSDGAAIRLLPLQDNTTPANLTAITWSVPNGSPACLVKGMACYGVNSDVHCFSTTANGGLCHVWGTPSGSGASSELLLPAQDPRDAGTAVLTQLGAGSIQGAAFVMAAVNGQMNQLIQPYGQPWEYSTLR